METVTGMLLFITLWGSLAIKYLDMKGCMSQHLLQGMRDGDLEWSSYKAKPRKEKGWFWIWQRLV